VLGAIYWSRIDKIYFCGDRNDAADIGFDDLFIYEEINVPYLKRKINTQKIKHPETNLPFLAWLKKEDKTCY